MADILDGLEVELSSPEWMERMSKACPCCGSEMELSPGLTSPNAGKAVCRECGFHAMFTAPASGWDSRWNNEPITL